MQPLPPQSPANFQVQEAPRPRSPMRVRAPETHSICHQPAPRASSPPKRPSRGRDSAGAASGGIFGPLRRGARGEAVAPSNTKIQAAAAWEMEEQAIVKTLQDQD